MKKCSTMITVSAWALIPVPAKNIVFPENFLLFAPVNCFHFFCNGLNCPLFVAPLVGILLLFSPVAQCNTGGWL